MSSTRARERFAIGPRLQAVTGGLRAIKRRGLAVNGRLGTMLGRFDAVPCGALSLLSGAHDDLRARDSALPVTVVLSVASRHRQITHRSGPIASERRDITRLRAAVSLGRAQQPRIGGLLTLTRRALTNVTAGIMRAGVDAVRKVTIAGGLIAIRRHLI